MILRYYQIKNQEIPFGKYLYLLHMTARNTRPQEIFRIAIMSLVGAVLMWGTVILFQNDGLLGKLITRGSPDDFIKGTYSPWATGIFLVSTISTILWYVLACITPDRGFEKNLSMKATWAILSTFPLIATVLFVFFNPIDYKQVEWLCIFFFLIIGCLGYWLSTALNSPYPFQWIPLLSQQLRQLFKID